MTPEERAAYVNAMVACASIRAIGMQAENEHRAMQGLAPAYGEEQFAALIDEYGIHHNAVLGRLGHES